MLRKKIFACALGSMATLFTVTTDLNAQPPGGGGPDGDPPCWPPPCVPMDGGISILLAAGAAFGARKMYKDRKG